MFTESEKEFLNSQSICRLATVSNDGWPHNIPVGYAFDGESFFITSDPNRKKLRNIENSNKVCLVVDVVQKPRKAVMIQGYAELIHGGEEFHRIMEFIEKQRGWRKKQPGEQVIIKVKPVKKVSWGL